MSTYFYDSWLAKKNSLEYVKDKKVSSRSYMTYMMIRLQKMFKYENLPDTIPREMLEFYLIQNGTCFITEVEGELYAFTGSMGGVPDPYYRPTRYIIANPALNLSRDCDIKEDGVLMRNDSMWCGLYPLMSRYATMMAENILTIRSADVMLRVLALLTAPDDRTKVSAEAYLKKLENGEFGVIAEKRFLDDGLKMQNPPSNNGSYLTQFIELQQYFKGSFYNEIGLNANFNMKREAIGDGEASLSEDSLFPLCEEMLRCRQEDIEKVNAKYGTNIKVDFDSSWLDNQKELELQMEVLKADSQLAEGEETDEQLGQDDVVEGTDDAGEEGNSETELGADGTSDDGACGDADEPSGEPEEPCNGEDNIDTASDAGVEIDIDVNINTEDSQLAEESEDEPSEKEEDEDGTE